MAFVVARPKGRFEIRESVHTPQGPRARSLANFKELDEEVLDRARRRATRPFDTNAVRAAAARAAAARSAPGPIPRHELPATRQFVEASRRMAAYFSRRTAWFRSTSSLVYRRVPVLGAAGASSGR